MGARHRFAVLVLVVLAGCGAVPAGGGSSTQTETLTAVPLEAVDGTDRRTTVPADVPSGISLGGSVDVRSLRRTHAEFIDDRSYTWVLTYSERGRDSETPRREFTRRVAVAGDQFLAEQYGPPPTANRSLFVDDTGGYLLVVPTNETEFDEQIDPSEHQAYAVGAGSTSRYLSGIDLNVDVVDRDGQTYYRLFSSTGAPPSTIDGFGTTVSNYSVTAYVTPEGLVKTLIVEYDRTRGDTIRHVSFRYDYSDIGSTTVSRPDWAERSMETPAASPTVQRGTEQNSATEPSTAGNATAD